MVPKRTRAPERRVSSFRAVLFRMVPKLSGTFILLHVCFRAVLFRMVPKLSKDPFGNPVGFRAVLFRMVPKRHGKVVPCVEF